MPLILTLLQNSLLTMREDVDGPGDSIGQAIISYTSGIIPVVSPPAKSAADSIFISSLNSISFSSDFNILFPQMLSQYALSLSVGMQPLFTSTPPPVPIIVSDITSVHNTKGEFSNSMSQRIDAWFRTGIAVNNTSGAIINWN